MAEAYIKAFRSAAKLAGKVRLGAKLSQILFPLFRADRTDITADDTTETIDKY